jgi:GABA permease
VAVRRHLIVANQTVMSSELLAVLHSRAEAEPSSFHIVLPMRHPPGAWSVGSAHATAHARLDQALEMLRADGLEVTGEVGDANPVAAAGDALLGDPGFDEVIVSTLPPGASYWIGQGVPHRIAHEHPGVPVTHVAARMAEAGAG